MSENIAFVLPCAFPSGSRKAIAGDETRQSDFGRNTKSIQAEYYGDTEESIGKRATMPKEETQTNRTSVPLPAKRKKGRPSKTEQAPAMPEHLPKKAGRKKSKVQISVRIDQKIMEVAYAHIRKTGDRITDFIERGFWLALNEDLAKPVVPGELRFLVVAAEPEERRLATALFVLQRLHRVGFGSELIDASREFILRSLSHLEAELPPKVWQKALADYSQGTQITDSRS